MFKKSKFIFLLILCFVLITIIPLYSLAENDFDSQLLQLKTPCEQMLIDGSGIVRTGDSFYHPEYFSGIIPTDKREEFELPAINGSFTSSDKKIAEINNDGLITAIAEGKSILTYEKEDGTKTSIEISIKDNTTPLDAQNLVYTGLHAFLATGLKRLSKANDFSRWYYKSNKEVGWCSVFASYCINFAGIDTYKYNTIPIDEITESSIFGVLEGQVGHQWDAFSSVDRFVNIPRPGYLVIYGDRSNEYRFTHVGLVVEVEDMSDGWYKVRTVEGNMSNTVKSYCYMYNSNVAHPKENMAVVDESEQDNDLIQYALHTDHWDVFGFCASWI